jgi:diguanylate cyclase (GGDEF)-like protein
VASRRQEHTTAFVTLPIVFLGAAAFAVVIGSLIIGARETNSIALAQQRATIEHAFQQQGYSLARELRVQTVWNEAYEKTLAGDREWMRAFYGEYLCDLFGYDLVYVLSNADKPTYGYANKDEEPAAELAQLSSGLKDLVAAVRDPHKSPPGHYVITTPISQGNGETLKHRAIADVRNIRGIPAIVVLSTIVPDRPPKTPFESPSYILIAVQNLDSHFTNALGTGFGFRNLKWISGPAPANDSVTHIKSASGADVGTLAWRRNEPGWQFVRSVAVGLTFALLLLAGLATILMRWGRQKARQIFKSEAEARHAARTDSLTRLPNRIALGEILPKSIEAAVSSGSTLGLIAVDIDHFKEINDDFGHAIGDSVMLSAVERLRGLLKASALLTRADGDEFLILVPGIEAEGLAALASQIVSALAEPIETSGPAHVLITASAGYALAPRDGDVDDDLVRRVELALNEAKVNGGGCSIAFAPEMDLEFSRRRAIELALRKAIANDAIDVVYQPIMDATGMRVQGVEALARWTDPLMGPISPDVFVPIAEENGLIPKIGEIVFRRAVADGLAWPQLDISVNISGAQIHHADIVSMVRDVLATSKFPPERLVVEITESVLLVDEKRADEQIKGLQSMGVKVALDDFGSGYSSLVYLRKFGFDKLKIDRSFIEEIGQSEDSTLILATVIRLALELRLVITAEGVETQEQQHWLERAGCHQLQGYLFSRPLSVEQVNAFLKARRTSAAE